MVTASARSTVVPPTARATEPLTRPSNRPGSSVLAKRRSRSAQADSDPQEPAQVPEHPQAVDHTQQGERDDRRDDQRDGVDGHSAA
jgi:hypothetical protein